MIHFNPHTRTFNLHTAHSYYAFQIDHQARLIHLGWGVRPPSSDSATLAGDSPQLDYEPLWSFITQFRPDELLTFGDLTAYHTTLKAQFPSLPHPPAPHESTHLPTRDLRLRYHSHSISENAQPAGTPTHGLPSTVHQPRQTLRVTLQDAVQPLQVTLCYRITPELDILERWLELENHGSEPIQLDVCYSASLHLPNGTTELTYTTGTWAREFTPSREKLGIGTRMLESRTLQTSHYANPFFMLNHPGQAWEQHGTVYFGALAYSGSWQMVFEQLPTWDMRLHVGWNPQDDRISLLAGETLKTPALVCGVCPDGWGGASRRLHRFARERVLPKTTTALRPVLYNSWEATYFDLNFAGQLALAQKAAQLGVELFCVDDGWFGQRNSDRAGLGDWFVRPSAFPDGLEKLVAEIHRLGMRFGLWVEPEMVNPDSDLYRAHPDWVLHFPGAPRTESRNQLVLDLGRSEVREHLFHLLDDLVRRYAVSFFKWDMNRLASEPGSTAGQAIWRAHTAGVYEIMDRLRSHHPQLEIQSCSGGGGRVDLGILAHTEQVWASDNTDALDRTRIQEGFSLAYPARTMEAWVTHEMNHQTLRVLPLALRFDVAMRGALGIGSNLNELSDYELREYASYIAFYKKIRHVVQTGDLYRLERLEEFGASAIEYVLPDGSEAVFSLVVREHQIGSYRPAPVLVGLQPHSLYSLWDVQQKLGVWRGYELMTLGLVQEVGGPVGYSRTYWLVKE